MSYPDQDSAGGTLHISCLTHPPSVDAIPALKQLRRSFSRSPAQSSPFRLHTNSTIPSAADTSLSPLALMRALSPRPRQREMTASDYLSPKAPPTVPATRKIKLSLRRAPPFRSSPRCRGSPTDKIRPALHNATNRANSTPSPLSLTSSEDEEIEDISPDGNENFDPKHQVPRSTKFTLNDTPIRFDFAKPKLDTIVPVKSSPLKRADLTVHPDEASFGSPVAKRRSLHAATLVLDSDCQVPYALPSFVQSHHNRSGLENENNNFFASSSQKQSSFLPKPFSLRKSTLQQRYSSNVTSSPKSQRDCSPHPTLHLGTNLRTSHRHSLDSSQDATIAIFQSPARPDLSKEPTVPTYQAYTKPTDGRPHPLSNSTTPLSPLVAADAPSTKSSLEDDSYKASFVFSKSLPIGALRPQAPTKKIGIDDDVSYATPKGYKIAKPLPAAFMSTGLISKRNRQMDDHLAETFAGYAMPDTPSKRSSFPPVKMISPMRQSMIRPAHNPPEFGTPTTPLSPYSSRSTTGAAFGKGVGIFGSRLGRNESQRKSSFASIEGDDVLQSPTGQADSQSSNDDLPPTPTKHAKVDTRNRSYGNSLRSSLFGRRASLAPDSFVAPSTQEQPLTNSFADASPTNTIGSRQTSNKLSPQTPQDSFAPPDPSSLSISGQSTQQIFEPFTDRRRSVASFPPATPTANREQWLSLGSSHLSYASITGITQNDVDTSITARFGMVQSSGGGEFSKVYRVGSPLYGVPRSSSKNDSSNIAKIWAIKRTRRPFVGPRDRELKIRELNVLKALRGHDHVIEYVDSWESNNFLYIQTEFCENGNLKTFLTQTGYKGRLDDFRIWKILLELASGIQYIHDNNFIHLDLKPANVFIDWEGVLKIGDFGLASPWPAPTDLDGEGDREYIGPEVLSGQFDKPADIFALGMIMLEIAGNIILPDNGTSWQRLRTGDLSDLPGLTFSSENSLERDRSGDPIHFTRSQELVLGAFDDNDRLFSGSGDTVREEPELGSSMSQLNDVQRSVTEERAAAAAKLTSRLTNRMEPPNFMVDPSDPEALDGIVQWMISPQPADRPVIARALASGGVLWVARRRRAGATVYEGNWGPADDVLQPAEGENTLFGPTSHLETDCRKYRAAGLYTDIDMSDV